MAKKGSQLTVRTATEIQGGEFVILGYAGRSYQMTLNELKKFIGIIEDVGGSVDLTQVTTDILPLADASKDIGSLEKRWKKIYSTALTVKAQSVDEEEVNIHDGGIEGKIGQNIQWSIDGSGNATFLSLKVNGADVATMDYVNNELSKYVTTDTLTKNYVSNASLTETLKKYYESGYVDFLLSSKASTGDLNKTNTQLGIVQADVATLKSYFQDTDDVDDIINKWRELEAFLAGQTETSTLADLLSVKADKETVTAINSRVSDLEDADFVDIDSLRSTLGGYYTKEDVDALLGEAGGVDLTGYVNEIAASGTGNGIASVSKDGSKLIFNKATFLTDATVPAARTTFYGGIKIGYKDNGKNYGVLLDDSGKAYVNVPWESYDLSKFLEKAGGSVNYLQVSPANASDGETVNIGVTTNEISGIHGNGVVDWKINSNGAWIGTNQLATQSWADGKFQTQITGTNKLSYSLISGTPTLATVATSGNYNDLSNKPTIPDVSGYVKDGGSVNSLGITSINTTTIRTQGDYIRQSGSSEVWKLSTYGSGNNPIFSKPLYVQDGNSYNLLATQSWVNSNFHSLTTVDTVPTLNSSNLVTSGGVAKAVADLAESADGLYQRKITSTNKLAYSLISGTPTLATVATSGSYNDLTNKPTIPSAITESTVSDWGFTKNKGTITGIKMNGASKGTSGVVDLGTVVTKVYNLSFAAGTPSIGSGLTYSPTSEEKTINIPTKTSHLTNDSNFITSVTDALGYTPYNSANFTKANIKSTLGISDWALASSKPTYTAAEVGALPSTTAIPNSTTVAAWGFITEPTLNDKLADYLPLSGGTLSRDDRNVLTVNSNQGYGPMVGLSVKNVLVGYMGIIPNKEHGGHANYGLFLSNIDGSISLLLGNDGNAYISKNINNLTKDYTLIHSGNIGSQSVANADSLNSQYVGDINNALANRVFSSGFQATNRPSENYATGLTLYNTELKYTYQLGFSTSGTLFARYKNTSDWQPWKTIAFTDSTVAAANSLKNSEGRSLIYVNASNGDFYVGDNVYQTNNTYLLGKNVYLRYGADAAFGFILNSSGNVGIGTTNPNTKLHVVGGAKIEGALSTYGITATTNAATDAAFTHYVGSTKLWWVSSYNNCANFNTALYVQSGSSPIKVATVNDLSSYLPKAGGTISNPNFRSQLTIERSNSVADSVIAFNNNKGLLGSLGCRGADGIPCVWLGSRGDGVEIIHAENISSYALSKAGGTISGSLTFSSTSGSHIIGNSNSEIIFQPSNDTSSANIPLKIAKTGSSTYTMYCDESEVYDLGTSSYKWNILYCRSASQSSDATLKNILGNIELTTSQIANAPAVNFTWKNGGTKDVGTIAQYWKNVLPEVVSGEEGSYGMNYAVLGVVSAIILARNIETHEQRIARLEKEKMEMKAEAVALKAVIENLKQSA